MLYSPIVDHLWSANQYGYAGVWAIVNGGSVRLLRLGELSLQKYFGLHNAERINSIAHLSPLLLVSLVDR
jgi:hypothetical protein